MNKTYTIKFNTLEDGSKKLSITNDGFDLMELLDILTIEQAALTDCLKNTIKPTDIKREVIL